MTNAKTLALGGILAALAVVFMTLGGLIPGATYIAPTLCCILLQTVFSICGKRIGWAWYIAVSILGLLLSPDKESAAVFLAIGQYPLIKPRIDGRKGAIVVKLLYFNSVIFALYCALIFLFGMEYLLLEFQQLGLALLILVLLLGNIWFFLLDHALSRFSKRRKRSNG